MISTAATLLLTTLLLQAAPAPALAPAPGPADPGCEHLFQGDWQLSSVESGIGTGTLHVDGRKFRASNVHGEYKGTIAVRSDASPAELDFTIRECGCIFEGMTAAAIFYEEAGGIVFAAPAPGEARPTSFEGLDLEKILLERATRDAGDDAAP